MLLSTDTEIDATLYNDLKPAIARAYQLTYQPGEASSRVEEGYFWQEAAGVGIEVLAEKVAVS